MTHPHSPPIAENENSFSDRLRALPKAELHVHLRGAMPIDLFTELLNKYPISDLWDGMRESHKAVWNQYDNIRPFLSAPRRTWTVDEVAPLFRYESFDQFLATWILTRYYIRDAEDFQRLVSGVVAALKRQGIVYAEITLSISEYVEQGVSLDDIRACMDETRETSGIRVQWIIDLVRDYGCEAGMALLEKVLALECRDIVGITIGGSEHHFPPAQFEPLYNVARERGMRLSAHSGEASGPESIWDAIRVLKVERIGHGVRAIEDESLVKYLAENQIPLEVCPTSNLCTGIFPTYAAHPVRSLYEAGVPITINTDDPTFFGTTLIDEYLHLYELGTSENAIYEMIRNGFRYSFLPGNEIARNLSDLEECLSI